MEFKIDIHGKIQDFEYWHKRFDENIGTPDKILSSNVESTQMYGYKLLSQLGGKKVIKNFDKVDLFIYAEIQSSMELPTFTIIDLENNFYGF